MSALDKAGLDHHAVADHTALIVAKMIFEDGFFHADPHPGNFFIEPTRRVGVIDFGMVGTLDDRLREQLGRLLNGFLRQDPGRLADALLALGTSSGEVDRDRLRGDLGNLVERHIGRSIGEISLRSAIGEMLEIVRRHRLRVPRDLSLLFTMLIIAEGVVAEVDPEFRFAEALAPYARRHLASGLTPARAIRRMEAVGVDLAELAAELPSRLNRISEAIETVGATLARQSGAEIDRAGRVTVPPRLHASRTPGSVRDRRHDQPQSTPRRAEVAMQSGFHAARTIKRRLNSKNSERVLRYIDLGSMATIARFRAVVYAGPLCFAGLLGWLAWLLVHLVFLTGFKNRVAALANWTTAFLGRGRRQRTITLQQLFARTQQPPFQQPLLIETTPTATSTNGTNAASQPTTQAHDTTADNDSQG